MKSIFRNFFLLVLTAAVLLLFSGCSANAQTKAITDAIVAYTDYYIEVHDLGDQIKAQSGNVTSGQSFDLTIFVDIPDYTKMDPDQAGFTLPEPSVSSRSANAYQQQVALALRQSLDQYAMKNGAPGYIQIPVTFTLSQEGIGWTANMTSQSKLNIQKTVEEMILGVLSGTDAYRGDYRLMQVSSALSGLLTDAFGGLEYAQTINVTSVTPNEDASYTASFDYPDPTFVYGALGDAYVASFNQPFYGNERVAKLTTEGLQNIRLDGAAVNNATVRVSYDETAEAFTLLDDGGLPAIIAEAKAKAESDASAAVNAQWRVTPLEIPANASILEGASDGNTISFKTGASLGKYFYVRFYAISGEDTSEEGTLQLGVFIIGGKSAKVKLPTGYYRVSCVTGANWYGLEQLFGSDAKTYNGASAIQSRKGYVNNISFE